MNPGNLENLCAILFTDNMPELPEVETIRRDLQAKIVSKKIADVLVLDKRSVSVSKRTAPDKIVKSDLGGFKKMLVGNKFSKIERRGKLLIFNLGSKQYLLVHLKMTGQLIYVERGMGKEERGRVFAGGHSFNGQSFDLPDRFTKIVLEFSDESKLFFNDMRVFGYMKIVDEREKEKIVSEFGVEALLCHSERSGAESRNPFFISEYSLAKRIDKETHKCIGKGSLHSLRVGRDDILKRKTSIKALLMNQKIIAGIGNIYADEICFCAKIKPARKVDSLTPAEIKQLFKCIPQVLKLAIENRGTTFNNYVDSAGNKGGHVNFLKVYGRMGEKCKRCHQAVIKKTKMGGRGTHFCPECQI